MDETRTALLADDLRKITTSEMTTSGNKKQAHGFFVRGRSNERGKCKRGKPRSKSRPLARRSCFKCGKLGHFKVDCPNKRVGEKKNNNKTERREGKEKASYISEGLSDIKEGSRSARQRTFAEEHEETLHGFLRGLCVRKGAQGPVLEKQAQN
ncbi:glycine-rich RNA-binding protein RZ1A-like [Asparagus officinalis]|uniref:glycine-rich RNA-binding protein RZ1A-like n=1 Tax=Asparagus officinalis TaxID=4686 RepID=UPI00098DF0D9|nr:glycine-rich RNA-binding protein RZ1A-like [Asparagus officinalis]